MFGTYNPNLERNLKSNLLMIQTQETGRRNKVTGNFTVSVLLVVVVVQVRIPMIKDRSSRKIRRLVEKHRFSYKLTNQQNECGGIAGH